ncbi:hypothetical protein LINPERPRIM_LOCUS14616 [Linum perenne]
MVASMALFFLGTNIFRYKQDQDSISKNHFLTIFRLFICRITSSSHKPVVAELEYVLFSSSFSTFHSIIYR